MIPPLEVRCARSLSRFLTYTATLPGGDLQGFGNIEYRIPIVGPVQAALFFDGGTNGISNRSGLQLDPSALSPQNNCTGLPPISLVCQFPCRQNHSHFAD